MSNNSGAGTISQIILQTGRSNGRYLLVNIGDAAGNYGVLYSKPIVDVFPINN
jgi:hypothetical protein